MKRSIFVAVLLVMIIALAVPTHTTMAKRYTYTSGFQVQNLSTSVAASVNISYYYNQKDTTNPGKFATSATDEVQPNTSNTYFPIHPNAGFDGSVVISSSQPVASIVNLLGFSGTTFKGGASYIGASAGSTSVQIPLLMKGNASGNIDTWFSVQNVGSDKTSVTVTYTDGMIVGPVTLEANASYMFDQQTEPVGTPPTGHPSTSKVFAATVTSSANSGAGTTQQPLVAVVVQETSGGMVLAYTGFSGGSTNPVFPLVNAQLSRKTQTGITIRNIGDTDTDVTLEYVPADGSAPCTETRTIGKQNIAGFALEIFAGDTPAGVTSDCNPTHSRGTYKMVGSAYVKTNSANMPLVGVLNQITPTAGSAYSGFDPATATNSVVFPLIMDRNAGYFTSITVMNQGAETSVTCKYAGVTGYDDTQTIPANGSMVLLQNNHFAAKYVGSAICSSTDAAAKLVGVVNEVVAGSPADTLLTYEGTNSK